MKRNAGSLMALLCFAALCAWALSQVVGPSCGPTCRVECSGTISPGTIDYKPTDYKIVLWGEDPVASQQKVQQDLAPLGESENKIRGGMCSREGAIELNLVRVPSYPASALATNLGPAIFVTARALAQLWVRDVTFSEFQFIQTCDPDGGEVKASCKGALVHTLQAFDYTEVVSHGSLYTLITGAAKVKDTLSNEEKAMIAFLKPIADKLLDAVEKYILDRIGNILPKDAKRAIAKMKRAITSAKLDLGAEAEYDVNAKVNTTGGGGGTSAVVAVKLDEDAGVFSAHKRYAKPFVGYPVDKSNADKVVIAIEAKAVSSAKALGKRGDASAMAANMTAFFSFVACKDDQGGVDYQFFPFQLTASSDEDALSQLGGSVILGKYDELVSNFNVLFNERAEEVNNMLGNDAPWEKCVATKARLDAIQEEMSDLMVQYREQIVAAIELETKNNK